MDHISKEPFSDGRHFMRFRKRSDVYYISAKPVSSPNRMKTILIAGTVLVGVGIVVAIAVAITINMTDQGEEHHSSLQAKGGAPVNTTSQTTDGAPVNTTSQTTDGTPVNTTSQTTDGTAVDTTSQTTDGTAVNTTSQTTDGTAVDTTSQTTDDTAVDTTSQTTPGTTDGAPINTTSQTTDGAPVNTTLQTTVGTPVDTTSQTTPGIVTFTEAQKDGTWNKWGAWTSCGATCGTGSKTRYRTCHRSSPSGPICAAGEYVQTTTCSLATCPVYGVWATWSGWAGCDVTCGGGTQERTRVCQKASLSDLDCVGRSSQSQTCNLWNCPDCSQTCTTGSLNADCTACECTSNTVQGIVRNHVNVPLGEASIAHASVPYKTLATTNGTGGFTLTTACDAVEIVITREGYADVTVVVTGTTVSVQMSLIQYPAIKINPRPRVRVQGENVTFCCEAFGNPAISNYEWMKDGVLLDDSKYPDGFNLTLNDVTTSDSGEYRCRANSPVGAVYSSSALLTVKSTESEFCDDAYEEKKISLPSDCEQDDGTTLYEVGGCAEKTCRGNSSEDGFCGPTENYCCLPSSEEERTVQCNGYTLKVIVTTGCSCGQCSSGDITIEGEVTGINTGIPLRLGTVYVNGSSVATTSFTGVFSLTVPAGTLNVAITLEDTFFQTLMTTTKLISLGEATIGTVYQKITLLEAPPPIIISSDVENTIPMGNDSGMPAVTEVVIPPNTYVDTSGNPYTGVVKASVNLFDPRDLSSISTAPGSFEFTDEEGEMQNLQTFGVIVMDFKDESGNKLNVNGNVTIKLDADLVESTYSGNLTDVKLWGLNTVTGIWEEVGAMVEETTTRKKRQTVGRFIIGNISISTFPAINLDCYSGFRRCYYKMSVYDANNAAVTDFTVRIIHMGYPGERFPGTSSTYVTTVKETLYTHRSNSFTFCRHDSWGYIQVYRGNDIYYPGNSSLSGLTPEAISRLDYDTATTPATIKAKFLSSSDGPLYHSTRGMTQNSFRFFEPFKFQKFTLFDVAPIQALAQCGSSDKGPMLWYPPKSTSLMEFKLCMIKIRATGNTAGLSFIVKSKAGKNSGIEDTILGAREVEVENGGACVEYKCSGVYPLLKTFAGAQPTMLHDYTKVMIQPYDRFCTVTGEGGIQSHSINSGSTSNIGKPSLEWLIPDSEDHGIYIYEQTYQYKDINWDSFRDKTRNMCKEGQKTPQPSYDTMNAAAGPAVTFHCL